MFPIEAGFQRAIDGVEEVVAMILDVKRQQVVAQQAVENFLLPRADAEHLGIGPRNVPELGDDQIRAGVLEHARQQREMVVLYEDDRRPIVNLGQHGIGEFRIDVSVVLPIGGVETRPGVGHMAQGPEGLVRGAVIVALLFPLVEPHAAQRIRGILGRNGDAIESVGHGPIGVAAAVSDPNAAASLHDRIERGRQTARRTHAADFTILINVDIRLSIGDHDEFRVAKPLADGVFQSFPCPSHITLLYVRSALRKHSGASRSDWQRARPRPPRPASLGHTG